MKRWGQSRKEAPQPKDLISSRTSSRFGLWNVRTMNEAGKAHQIATEMNNYKLDLLGICETRWKKSGECRLSSGQTVIYSGNLEDNAIHSEGVGIMLTGQAKQAMLGWKPLSSRLMTAEFRTTQKNIKLHVIVAYAPTNDKDQEVKESFYRQLENTVQNIPSSDMTIVMGDFNAKIGSNNTAYEEILGKQGLGDRNENGDFFVDFCASTGMVIGGSIFPHKRIHKTTWTSPDLQTENQIDHICINRRFRRSLQDVRVFRGADVASDHHLVVGKIKLKLKKHSTPPGRTKFNVELLKDPSIKEQFNVSIKNKFNVLQDLDEGTVDDVWGNIKEKLISTCKETLGHKERTHNKPWISLESQRLINKRKEKKAFVNRCKTRRMKTSAQKEYTEAMKDVKRSIRKDRRKYTEDLAREAEQAAGSGNSKRLYELTKQLAGKFKNTEVPIKNNEGRLLSSEEDQLERWREYFECLLNRPKPVTTVDIEEATTDLDISIEKPSILEIKSAIKKLKTGKAAGPDDIPPEILKADINTIADILRNIFDQVWESEKFPKDWREGYMVKIPKKGDLHDCNNYRGIMLLSVPGKVLSRIILERLKAAVEPEFREEQAGFRSQRSCADQIATLRIIVEQSNEWNASLYVNFVDFEKAFDSLDRDTLWKLMRHFGIPDKIVRLTRGMYQDMKCKVLVKGKLTDAFGVSTGVRQGCLLSPFLFLLAVDWLMKETTKGHRDGIQWSLFHQLEDLDFADDLALLSHSHTQMQNKTTRLNNLSSNLGLNIHIKKTKMLRINADNEPIILTDMPIEEVDGFTYLGSIIDKKGGTDEDIKARIQKARASFIMLRGIWKSKELNTRTKLRIFKTNVKTVLLYGSETWKLTTTSLQKLQSFVNRCLRQILGLKWFDMVRNKDLWERAQMKPIGEEIKAKRWKWIGHTLRRPATSTARQALTWNPQGHRKRGRPRMSWRRSVLADAKDMRKSWGELERVARDRSAWRKLVNGLCPTVSEHRG